LPSDHEDVLPFKPIFAFFWTTFSTFSRNFLWQNQNFANYLRKYYRKPIYRHFSNHRQIIDIKIKLPEIIGDLKELSILISISKFPGKLSKNYRYRKK